MLEWIRKHETGPGRPMRDPAPASSLLAELRGADPVEALTGLNGRLESIRNESGGDPKVRSDVLSRIEEAGAAHVAALLAQYLANQPGRQWARDAVWKSLFIHVSGLTGALGASARRLIKAGGKDASFGAHGAAAAARALRACRLLAKVCLVRYLSVPPKLWRLAYSVHAGAERAGCATTRVFLHSAHKTATTATQELVKLLMLHVSAPEMMAPEQIEVADRVTEQLGENFTLRPHDVTDNPFCFDPGGDLPPRRAVGPQPAAGAGARYFGPGMGFDALARIRKQWATARMADIKVFGKDIAPQAQVATVQHLLMFWRVDCPYSPPVHSQASGNLEVVHRYGQIWQHLFRARSAGGGLSLQADDEENPRPPETWALRDAGGNELGAEIPPPSGGWARCGEIAAVSLRGGSECWLGVIRRMHAESGHGLHADIAVLSREPLAVSLRALLTEGEQSVFSEASSRQFAFNRVQAILLADGSEGAQKPNLLLPPDGWKEGRVYEATIGESPRYLRGLQLLRRGEDYVRATFEWVAAPQGG
jgi:hypothetical protein